MRDWLIRIALTIFGLAIAAILLELAARGFGLAPEFTPIEVDQHHGTFESSPNPILRYVPKPRSAGISSYGIRDVEFALEKSPGTFRVVVIGDSIGWGFCNGLESLPMQSTFSKRVEHQFRDAPLAGYRAVEVVNLSVSGYDTVQEVEFLRVKGVPLRPDLVVVGYCLNDSVDASMELAAFRGDDGWKSEMVQRKLLRSAFSWSHLFRTVTYRVTLLRGGESESFSPSEDRRAIGFDRLRTLRSAEGFDTLVVIFPYLDSTLPYPYLEEHWTTRREALARDFRVIDLLEAFQRVTQRDISRLRGRCSEMHPDERGHSVAADAIEHFIRATYGARR